MKFEIIKNSQSNTGYSIPDDMFKGKTDHLYGWQFELVDSTGKIAYSEVKYTYLTPEEYTASEESGYMNWLMGYKGQSFTGRVIFRGYYEEEYSLEWRDYYLTKVA